MISSVLPAMAYDLTIHSSGQSNRFAIGAAA
jgi:hypothetical protein